MSEAAECVYPKCRNKAQFTTDTLWPLCSTHYDLWWFIKDMIDRDLEMQKK